MNEQELGEEINFYVREQLAMGFDSPDRISAEAPERFLDEADPATIDRLTAAALVTAQAELARDRATWPTVTDCDRLDAAFERLNAEGIMARHNWTCCGNCGRAEMPDEFQRLDGHWEGTPIIGYTFYHMQGTERAADGGGINLAYGSTERAESEAEYNARCLAVGDTICRVLKAHGLQPDWPRDLNRTINFPINWQRRGRPPRYCGDDDFADGCG